MIRLPLGFRFPQTSACILLPERMKLDTGGKNSRIVFLTLATHRKTVYNI